MTRKLSYVFLIFVISVLAAPSAAFADTALKEGDYQYFVETYSTGREAHICGYTGSEADLVIPETLGGCSVTKVLRSAVENNDGIHSIVFPSTMREIEEYAFNGCHQLSRLQLNEGLLKIGHYAFTGSNLSSVEIPSTVTSLGLMGAFTGNSHLNTIVFKPGPSNASFGNGFMNCPSLETAIVPQRTPENNSGIYSGCTGLKRAWVQYGVRTLGSEAFKGCESLEYLYIPPTVTEISYYAFTMDRLNPAFKIYGEAGSAAEYYANKYSIPFVESGIPEEAKPYYPIYRVYSPGTGEHLYTSFANEADSLSNSGWNHEGISWYAPDSGNAVYRLYNPALNDHLYTTDLNEVSVLTNGSGWVSDNGGQPMFYSGGSVPVYRLYNSQSGRHHLTTDLNEYNTLPAHGWTQEGTALQAIGK